MKATQRDIFTARTDGYVELIKTRMGHQEQFSVFEAAGIFKVSETVVREWIEEGRLLAANLNRQRPSKIDRRRDMRPLWRITRAAILDLAARAQGGY